MDVRSLIAVIVGTLAAVLLFVARTYPVRPRMKDLTPEYAAWGNLNTKRVSRTAIRLRDGDCMDVSRLPKPWVQEYANDPYPLDLHLSAPGAEVAIAPAGDSSIENTHFVPHDVRVHVELSGWSCPPPDLATPDHTDENVKAAYFRPLVLWKNPRDLEAYAFNGEREIVDKRRLTNCRDYGNTDLARCNVVSADEQYEFSVEIGRSSVAQLPDVLRRIGLAIRATKGTCPR